MSLERVRTQTRCWDPNVLMSERTYVRENSCLMLKHIKSITSKDVDSDEIKQRKYIGIPFFERICPSRNGAIMRYKHLSGESVPVWLNPYVIKIPLICSPITHYFKMKYNLPVLLLAQMVGYLKYLYQPEIFYFPV